MAKSNLSYKKSTTITLKAAGMIDAQRGMIYIDGVETPLASLFKDANGLEIEVSWKVKEEEDLEPNFDEEFDPDEDLNDDLDSDPDETE